MALIRIFKGPTPFLAATFLSLLLFLAYQHISSFRDDGQPHLHSESPLSGSHPKDAKDRKGQDGYGTRKILNSLKGTVLNPFARSRGKDTNIGVEEDLHKQHAVSESPKPKAVKLPAFCDICGPEDMWCRRYGYVSRRSCVFLC
jgi:hypothetical protein